MNRQLIGNFSYLTAAFTNLFTKNKYRTIDEIIASTKGTKFENAGDLLVKSIARSIGGAYPVKLNRHIISHDRAFVNIRNNDTSEYGSSSHVLDHKSLGIKSKQVSAFISVARGLHSSSNPVLTLLKIPYIPRNTFFPMFSVCHVLTADLLKLRSEDKSLAIELSELRTGTYKKTKYTRLEFGSRKITITHPFTNHEPTTIGMPDHSVLARLHTALNTL